MDLSTFLGSVQGKSNSNSNTSTSNNDKMTIVVRMNDNGDNNDLGSSITNTNYWDIDRIVYR